MSRSSDGPREQGRERWLQWVALTTTILAVCAAISTLRNGTFSTRVTLATAKENDAWAYYQAKSIKQHGCELHAEQLSYHRLTAAHPQREAWLDERLKAVRADINRYQAEKADIERQAKASRAEADLNKRRSAAMGIAVMLLQIAIMLASVSALLKRPPMWLCGLATGAGGIGYMVQGLFLIQ